MRLRLSIIGLVVVSLVPNARADEITSVLLPASEGKVPAKQLRSAEASIRKSVAAMGSVTVPDYDVPYKIGRDGAECAVDPACLVAAGKHLGATRVVGIRVSPERQTLSMTLVLVDVDSGALILETLETLPKRKLGKAGPVVVSFLRRAPTASQRAAALVDEAHAQYRVGAYKDALKKYSDAQRLSPKPSVKFHLAECHRQLGSHEQAADLYRSYLESNPNGDNKAAAQKHLAASKRLTNTRVAKLEAERKRAEEAARAEEQRRRLLIQQRRQQRDRYNRHPVRPWTYAGGLLGVAALGTGGFFALKARDDQSAFDDLGCDDPNRPLGPDDLATCVDLSDQGDRNSLLANVLGGTGIGLLLTSAVLFAIDPGNKEPESGKTGAARIEVGSSWVRATFTW